MDLFSYFHGEVLTALEILARKGELPPGLDLSRVAVEPPRDPSHGEVSTNAAMVLAKPAGVKPRDLAEKLAGALRAHPDVTEVTVAGFSAAMAQNDRALKNFLFERMYRHYKVNRMSSKARRIVQDLFRLFLDEPQCLPTEWRALADAPRTRETARIVADYIAGMTDRYALDEHARLFDTYSAH